MEIARAHHHGDTNCVEPEDMLNYLPVVLAFCSAALSPPLACVIENKKSLCFWKRPLISVAKQIQVTEQLKIISRKIMEGVG